MRAHVFLFLLILFGAGTVAAQTTITVTNTNNSGAGSLRQAVLDASANDTVRISPSLIAGGSDTIVLSSHIGISTPMVIKGAYNSTDTLYISGNNYCRGFYCNASGKLVLDSLAIIDGNGTGGGDHGGGIYQNGSDTLFVFNTSIKNCVGNRGGGVFGNNYKKIVMDKCDIQHNRSNAYGGGIGFQVWGYLRVSNSIISNNTCANSSGYQYYPGGGIGSYSQAIITNCTIEGNSAKNGGGVYVEPSQAYRNSVIDGCQISGNAATNGNGGGVATEEGNPSLDTLTVRNSTITNNTSTQHGAGIYATESHLVVEESVISNNAVSLNFLGGGIYAETTIEVLNSTISGNSAANSGGGVYQQLASGTSSPFPISRIENSTIAGNSSGGTGAVQGFEMVIRNSTITQNTGGGSSRLISCGGSCDFENITVYDNHYQSYASDPIYCQSCEISSSILSTVGSDPFGYGSSVTSNGYNIFSLAPTEAVGTDQVNVSAANLNLQALALNGGTTQTLLPGSGSLATDLGNPSDVSDAQNGSVVGRRDVGAAEGCNALRSDTIVDCASITWVDGNVYALDTMVVYTVSGVAAGGCDSTYVLNFDFVSDLTGNVTVIACDEYEWNGTTYDTSGTHVHTYTASTGCDSIVTLNLTIVPTYDLSETVTTCYEGSYTFPDGTVQSNITSQVVYTSYLQTVVGGCDSTIQTTVNVDVPDCSELQNLGNTESTMTEVCTESFTLSFDESVLSSCGTYSYMWQDSVPGGNWTDRTSDTTSTATVTHTDTTWYRCKVTCDFGGGHGFTTPIEITHYCPPCVPTYSQACNYMWISNIQIGDINNSSGCGTAGYSNYTSITTNAEPGETLTISATTYNYNMNFSVWLDLNGDGVFDTSAELMDNFSASTSGGTGSITVPNSISAGAHKLRIVSEYSISPTDPCQSLQYGETEDYTINVVVPEPCTSTPVLGNTLTTLSTVCDETFELSFDLGTLADSSGYNYQWQDSVAGGSWGDISSATNTTHSLTHSSATWYRCKVSCANGGTDGFTMPIEVAHYCPPCSPTYSTPCTYMWISNVSMSSINNSSSCGTDGYSNFTSQSFDAEPGESISFSFTREAYNMGYHIYMDLDGDGLFTGSGESLWSGYQGAITTTGTFTIPVSASVGSHTIRIVSLYNSTPTDPCGSYNYGETEDYTVNVTSSCTETTSSFNVARCYSYTVPSGNATYTTTGVYNDTITNAAGCDSVMTISVYIGEVPNITHFTSRGHDKFRVRWEYLLPTTVNDTNFRIRVWEKGYPAAYTDKSQFPDDFQKKFTDLESYTWYDVKVGFACADGSFIWSSTDSIRTKRDGVCPTPTNMHQEMPLENHRARVSWSGTGDSYQIRFRLAGASSWRFRSMTDTTKQIAGLEPGSTYEYQVKSYCSTGQISAYSPIAVFETDGGDSLEGGAFGRLSAEGTASIKLYPNPNKGTFNLDLPDASNRYNVIVFDILGTEIAQFDLNGGTIEMELTGLESGIYFLRSTNLSNGKSITTRFNIH